MPAYTPDNIALGIIAEGRRTRTGEGQKDHPPISDKGMKQAIACGLVESSLTMYASNADPDSLKFPHDKVGSDANSVGVFQQRDPWWGTVEDRMDVARSAAMFYNSLVKQRINGQDYNTDANTPGGWVQMVQRSAYPRRYDERWADATRIFDTLHDEALPPTGPTPPAPPHADKPQFQELEMWGNGSSSRSRPPINFLLHTEEGNSTAEQLAHYCDGSNNVSYHYTLRDRIVCDVVDTDRYSWSVLNANVFTINLCYAGSRAAFTREQWLQREADIDISAYLAVQDCTKYGFPTDVIAPPYHEAPGISDHKYVTEQLHIGTHTDVGNNYPWDVFTAHVNRYAGRPTTIPAPPAPTGDWLTMQRPSRSIYRTPGEPPIAIIDFILNIDAMTHMELTERLATEYGDSDAIGRIVDVAAGEGADPNDTWAISHAKNVLQHMNPDVLAAWTEKQKTTKGTS